MTGGWKYCSLSVIFSGRLHSMGEMLIHAGVRSLFHKGGVSTVTELKITMPNQAS
jgi:hypothetical protein